MAEKTHYRKIFKSDHLGQADIEDLQENGSDLIFTIDHVKQELDAKVAGRKINANIGYFKEDIKPMVLNATNSKTLSRFAASNFVEDWNSILVKLYIDSNVRMKGETVGGVRIDNRQPQRKPSAITPEGNDGKLWKKAKAAFVRDGNLDAVLKRYTMSDEHQIQIVEECNNEG